MDWRIPCAGVAFAASGIVFGHEPGPHVHGVARLQIAVDGPVLTMFLDSPVANLLGFEHYPKSESQKAAVRALGDRLRKAEDIFALTPAAKCSVTSVRLESPVLGPGPAAGASNAGHADLEAEYAFRCGIPAELREVEVNLFAGFPNMRQIDVQVAGSKGQAGATLTASRRRVSF